MKGWVAALALSVGMVWPRLSRAETPRVLVASLAVEKQPGTEGCVEEPALATAVEARLGRKVFGVRTPPDLVVRLNLDRPRPKEWRGEISLLDPSGRELGRRELVTKAGDCSALDASLALVVALLVNAPPNYVPPPPPASSEATAPPVTPAPPEPPPPRPASTRLELPRDTFAPREPWRVGIRAGGLGLLGVAPQPLFGAVLALGLRPPRLVELGLSAQFVPATRIEFEPGQGAKLTLLRLGLEVCPLEHDAGSLRLLLCAGQEIGWLEVEGFGFDENLSSGELSYAFEASGAAFWQLIRGFGPWLAVGAEVPLVRNAYYSGRGAGGRLDFYRAKPISGRAEIGLAIEF